MNNNRNSDVNLGRFISLILRHQLKEMLVYCTMVVLLGIGTVTAYICK